MVLVMIVPVRDINFLGLECSKECHNSINGLSAVHVRQRVETSVRIRQELQILRRHAQCCSGSGDFSITELRNPLTGGISGGIAKASSTVGQNDNSYRDSLLALKRNKATAAKRLVVLMRGKDNGFFLLNFIGLLRSITPRKTT
jgi:hypothetical protein